VVVDSEQLRPRIEHVMGMPIIVDIRDTDVETGSVDAVFRWFRLVDEVFSTYKPASEISRLGRGEITIDDVREDVRSVLQQCEELRVATGGYFNVRASRDALDPSGFVKGWSVDRAMSMLEKAGAQNYSINAGGDIAVRGGALPHRAWRIGLQHPKRRDSVARVLESNHLAVATSGSYERGTHIVDPHTGLAPTGVLAVTVAGPQLGIADAYATAAYARGPHSAEWTRELPARGYEALTITGDERLLVTPGFPAPPSIS
jgi:thiamine biosynthesis lipoprotein